MDGWIENEIERERERDNLSSIFIYIVTEREREYGIYIFLRWHGTVVDSNVDRSTSYSKYFYRLRILESYNI